MVKGPFSQSGALLGAPLVWAPVFLANIRLFRKKLSVDQHSILFTHGVDNEYAKQGRAFVPGKFFQSSLLFASKAGA